MEMMDIVNLHRLNQARMAMQIGDEPSESGAAESSNDEFYNLMLQAMQESNGTAGLGDGSIELPVSNGYQSASVPTLGGAAAPEEIQKLIESAAQKYGVDPKLIYNVIKAESSFRSNAVSKAGAQGLMQLMPSTAASYGVKDAFDPAQNIDGGVRLLRDLMNRYKGNTELVLAAYNAGVGAVAKYKGVPPYEETRNYVAKIMNAVSQA